MACLQSRAQDSVAGLYIDISKVGVEKKISKHIRSVYIDKKTDPASVFNILDFSPGLQHTGSVPNNYVTKKLLLRFNLFNPDDSANAVFFCPGFYFRNIRLYAIENGHAQLLAPGNEPYGYKRIGLGANDSATIMAELSFVKTYNNAIRPRLIQDKYIPAFIAELHRSYHDIDTLTFVFSGLLLMMMLFSLANFLQGANKDFLFYSGYAFFLGAMLFTQTLFHFRSSEFSYFLEGYLDFILQSTGIIFYMLFMQKFLSTRQNHPFLFKFYRYGIGMLIAAMLAYSFFHYFTDNYHAEFLVENAAKFLLLLMVLIFLVYSLNHWNDKLFRYVFWGNLFLFLFSLVSMLVILNPALKSLPGVFGSAIFYYEIGLLIELVFFLAGLNHKNRRQIIAQTKEREMLRAQNQLKEYEKELAVYKAQQEERQRISADMHDELGSGMTAIRLMSEIARNKMKENTPVELNKISASADDVLNKMNAIIWSMNSGNDTLDNLVSYIRSYTLEYFEDTPIQCKVFTPEIIPEKELTGDKRRNIFLSVKESLNNVMKHSKASNLEIRIEVNHMLRITIADDGVGIDLQKLRQFGNGLKNITRRMEGIGGSFRIENSNGTLTTLELPL